jgi:hypothetical protein
MTEKPATDQEILDTIAHIGFGMGEIEQELIGLPSGADALAAALLDKWEALYEQKDSKVLEWRRRARVDDSVPVQEALGKIFSAGNIGPAVKEKLLALDTTITRFDETIAGLLLPLFADKPPPKIEIRIWVRKSMSLLADVEQAKAILLDAREKLLEFRDDLTKRGLPFFLDFRDRGSPENDTLREIFKRIGLLSDEHLSNALSVARIERAGENLLKLFVDGESEISAAKQNFKQRTGVAEIVTGPSGMPKIRSEAKTDGVLAEQRGVDELTFRRIRVCCTETKSKLVEAFGPTQGRGMHP